MNTYYNNEDYTMIIHSNKIQYKKNQHIKYNFRENINEKDLDEGIIINFPYNNVYYSYKSPSINIPLNRTFRRSGVIPYIEIKTSGLGISNSNTFDTELYDGISNSNTFDTEVSEIENFETIKYFCLAVDSKYGNLTDFGGGVKKYETFAGAASRELEEESLGVFKIGPETIYNCSTAVYDFNTIIMFLRIEDSRTESLRIDTESTNPGAKALRISDSRTESLRISDSRTKALRVDSGVESSDTSSLIDSTIYEYFKNLSSVVESETKGIFWIREDKFYELIKSGKSVKFDGFYYPSIYKVVGDLLRSVSNINEII